LLGATVLASSDKKPPTFHKEVDKGMKLISTRPFGELAPITVYLSTAIDKSIIDDLEEKGIGLSELEKMKEKAFDMISTPNKGLGEVLAKYLPDVNEDYRKDQHVACATDVTGQGILILWEISKLTNST
ncbi:MAG: selenophosphate synthase-like protein, partial [Caldisphaeraceae archaeon]|nr:selenophosphate synthase-like protein [Caldisphaeraceae archaeon]